MGSAPLLKKPERPRLLDFTLRKGVVGLGLWWAFDICFDLLVSYESVHNMLVLGMF